VERLAADRVGEGRRGADDVTGLGAVGQDVLLHADEERAGAALEVLLARQHRAPGGQRAGAAEAGADDLVAEAVAGVRHDLGGGRAGADQVPPVALLVGTVAPGGERRERRAVGAQVAAAGVERQAGQAGEATVAPVGHRGVAAPAVLAEPHDRAAHVVEELAPAGALRHGRAVDVEADDGGERGHRSRRRRLQRRRRLRRTQRDREGDVLVVHPQEPVVRAAEPPERGVVAVVADVVVAVAEHPVAPGDHQVALELGRDDHLVEHPVLGQRRAEVADLAAGGQEAVTANVDRQLVREPHGGRAPPEEVADRHLGPDGGGRQQRVGGGASRHAEEREKLPP